MDSFNIYDKRREHQVKLSHNLLHWHNKNQASNFNSKYTDVLKNVNTKENKQKKNEKGT